MSYSALAGGGHVVHLLGCGRPRFCNLHPSWIFDPATGKQLFVFRWTAVLSALVDGVVRPPLGGFPSWICWTKHVAVNYFPRNLICPEDLV